MGKAGLTWFAFGSAVLCFIVFFTPAQGKAQYPPHNMTFDILSDSNQNRDANFSGRISFGYLNLNFGLTSSKIQLDETESYLSTAGFLGLQSTPFYDWSWGVEVNSLKASEQIQVGEFVLFSRYYVSSFFIEAMLGWKVIKTELTETMQSFLETSEDSKKDGNLWWSLRGGVDWGAGWTLDAAFTQYTYTLNFGFLNRPAALVAGYTPASVAFANSLIDYSLSTTLNYFWRSYDLSLLYNYAVTEYELGEIHGLSPGFGIQWNRHWYTFVSIGSSISKTPDEGSVTSGYANLGVAYSW